MDVNIVTSHNAVETMQIYRTQQTTRRTLKVVKQNTSVWRFSFLFFFFVLAKLCICLYSSPTNIMQGWGFSHANAIPFFSFLSVFFVKVMQNDQTTFYETLQGVEARAKAKKNLLNPCCGRRPLLLKLQKNTIGLGGGNTLWKFLFHSPLCHFLNMWEFLSFLEDF